MAGYMRKLNGHVYDGTHLAGEVLENGVFVEITAADGVKKITKDADTILRVAEQTELWGEYALVQDVVSVGANEVFFVENEWDIKDNEDYDTAKYSCKVGDYVKMHRPLVGEQLVMTVAEETQKAAVVGTIMHPADGGTVAANA